MKELDVLRAENELLKEKARILDVLMSSDSLFTTRVVAETFGKSPLWLSTYLAEKKIQYKDKKDLKWKLYPKYKDMGYVRKSVKKENDDPGTAYRHWTGKGVKFIYELLKADGII